MDLFTLVAVFIGVVFVIIIGTIIFQAGSMRNTLTAMLAALGMGLFVGGIMGMIGGIFQLAPQRTVPR